MILLVEVCWVDVDVEDGALDFRDLDLEVVVLDEDELEERF